MSINAILFDLDGTLLPMDQEKFVHAYLGSLAAKLAPHGYAPQKLVEGIWTGTGAMVKNDGGCSNEEVFWTVFAGIFGDDVRNDEPLFDAFYRNEFQNVQTACGFDPDAAPTLHKLKEMGFRLVLATNPIFPAIATQSRIRWAGLTPEDFELVTTYENSRHCKPNPAYYKDIVDRLGAAPEECLMVGNDVDEDMIAATLGMKVFLLPKCLINRSGTDINTFPHGGFHDLLKFAEELNRGACSKEYNG